jgi:hypothetical protein
VSQSSSAEAIIGTTGAQTIGIVLPPYWEAEVHEWPSNIPTKQPSCQIIWRSIPLGRYSYSTCAEPTSWLQTLAERAASKVVRRVWCSAGYSSGGAGATALAASFTKKPQCAVFSKELSFQRVSELRLR